MVSGPIAGIDGPKTIGSFYGYSTIVFDFVRRAMPYNMPRTLTNDEVYAVTAYLLSINKIVGENDVMNAETLPKVRMPNRDNFIIRFPDRI
jgi:cytochrome c